LLKKTPRVELAAGRGGFMPFVTEPVRMQLYERLLPLYAEHFKDILLSREHLVQMTKDSLCEKRATEFLELIQERTGMSLPGKQVLEVGAGIGMALATARIRYGAEAYGIEPGDDEYSGSIELGRDLLTAAGVPNHVLQLGIGESIPYPDNFFDLVYSNNVLEHTNDPPRVIAESIRVLKPGGVMCHNVPNYGSWWEGHYGVVWLPHLNKFFGRMYLRLLGKNPAFLDTLQLITRSWLTKMLKPFQEQIEVLGWGEDIFQARLRTLNFSEYAALGRLKGMLRWLHRLGLVRMTAWLGGVLRWETPLILTVRKKAVVPEVSWKAAA
jgi:ubiquinone/menaquinone biosynthesis C-methylase UbiE